MNSCIIYLRQVVLHSPHSTWLEKTNQEELQEKNCSFHNEPVTAHKNTGNCLQFASRRHLLWTPCRMKQRWTIWELSKEKSHYFLSSRTIYQFQFNVLLFTTARKQWSQNSHYILQFPQLYNFPFKFIDTHMVFTCRLTRQHCKQNRLMLGSYCSFSVSETQISVSTLSLIFL